MTAAIVRRHDSEWRLLTIEDPGRRRRPHVVGLRVDRESCEEGDRIVGRITVSVYGLAGDAGDALGHHAPFLGRFGGSYSLSDDVSRSEFVLTGGSMMLDADVRGLRIGSYAQDVVVRWALAVRRPGFIKPICVVAGDATTAASRDRRNRFYEQFGINFEWDAPVNGIERAAGQSPTTLTITDIRALDFVEGVTVLSMPNAIRHFAQQAESERAAAKHAREAFVSARENFDSLSREASLRTRCAWLIAALASAFSLITAFTLERVGG